MGRVCSLEFRPYLKSPDSGLADPLLGSWELLVPQKSEPSYLQQSTIYSWSGSHFFKHLFIGADDSKEILARREQKEKLTSEHIVKCQHSSVSNLNNETASWRHKIETSTKTILLEAFSPNVIAADENEQIRLRR